MGQPTHIGHILKNVALLGGLIHFFVRVDGIDDYITGDGTGLPQGDRSISLWYYVDSDAAPAPVPFTYGSGAGTCPAPLGPLRIRACREM